MRAVYPPNYLQPLGTEGQGLSEYPDRKKYDLYKFCFFYGAGLKYQLNSVLNIGIEFRQTKTNTDYIDDVSTTYADENFLRAGNGQIAVDLAYRGDEYNGRSYPVAGTPRGNPNQDLYYFLGATVGLTLNDPNTGSFSLGGIFGHKGGRSNGARSQVACPRF
jgi:opacity protein-like surface antigen